MDINVDITELSAETKELLLRFQVAHLHYLFYDYFSDIPGEVEWLEEFRNIRRAVKECAEERIADIGKRLLDFDGLCQETDAEGERLVEAGKLSPDDYQSWFNARLDERSKEIAGLENVLHRLSLKVGDKRPTFFKQVN